MKLTILILLIGLITGCGQKDVPHESTQSYLQVTSPPTQVTMIIPKYAMTDKFICKITREVKQGKYYNYPFNAAKTITLNANANRHLSDTESDTDVTSFSVTTP